MAQDSAQVLQVLVVREELRRAFAFAEAVHVESERRRVELGVSRNQTREAALRATLMACSSTSAAACGDVLAQERNVLVLVETVHEDDAPTASPGRWLAQYPRQPLAAVVPHRNLDLHSSSRHVQNAPGASGNGIRAGAARADPDQATASGLLF